MEITHQKDICIRSTLASQRNQLNVQRNCFTEPSPQFSNFLQAQLFSLELLVSLLEMPQNPPLP